MNRLTKILFIAMAVAVGFDAYAVPKKDGYKLVWKDNPSIAFYTRTNIAHHCT